MSYIQMRLDKTRHFQLKKFAIENGKDLTSCLSEAVDSYLYDSLIFPIESIEDIFKLKFVTNKDEWLYQPHLNLINPQYTDYIADFKHLPTDTYYEICSSKDNFYSHKSSGQFDLCLQKGVKLKLAFFTPPDDFLIQDYTESLRFPDTFISTRLFISTAAHLKLKILASNKGISVFRMLNKIIAEFLDKKGEIKTKTK